MEGATSKAILAFADLVIRVDIMKKGVSALLLITAESGGSVAQLLRGQLPHEFRNPRRRRRQSMDDQRDDREGSRVKAFWIVVSASIGLAVVAIYAVNLGPFPVTWIRSAWRSPVYYLSTGILVAVLWAIAFRPQLAGGRFTLSAVFALMAMEAIFLLLVRFCNPFWAM